MNPANLNPDVQKTRIGDDATTTVIPVIQEELSVEKYVRETGKVRISKRISEHEEIVDEPLFREEVQVERVPVNQFVESLPPVRNEGGIMIIPVVEEQIFIQKRLVLVEELHVRKQTVETHKPQRITLRKEEVNVKRVAPDENSEG